MKKAHPNLIDKMKRQKSIDKNKDQPILVQENAYNIIARHKAKTTRTLSYILVSILALSVISHYIVTVIPLIFNKTTEIEALDRIFMAWLPVIASLVSSAVTYYFTKEKS